MKKLKISLLVIYMLLVFIPSSIRAEAQPIRFEHNATSLAYFANGSIVYPAINSSVLGSGFVNENESINLLTRESLVGYSNFVFSNPTNQWVYYNHTIIYVDDGDPSTVDRINVYGDIITYENLVSHNPSREISAVSISYSYATQVTVNYIDDETDSVLDTIIYYGRRAHYHEFEGAVSSFLGDPITISTQTFNGYSFDRIARDNTHANMIDYNYEIDVYYNPVKQYVITYTDGTGDESVFEDEVITANEHDPSPAFTGSTARPGYTFIGWTPAVDATVTGSRTYTATWSRNTHVISYTDGTGNESIFEDEVITANENDPSPAFTGSTARPGYTFIGWTPAVDATVTGSKTYTATWHVNQTDGVMPPEDSEEQPKLPNAGISNRTDVAYVLVAIGLIIIKKRKTPYRVF